MGMKRPGPALPCGCDRERHILCKTAERLWAAALDVRADIDSFDAKMREYRAHFEQQALAVLPLFAKAVTDAAIERVDAAAPADWKEEAAEAIYQVCLRKPVFTPDDIWLAGLSRPRESRAFGPAMMRAVKEGWCKPNGQFVCSVIPSQHRNPIRVYVSLLSPVASEPSAGAPAARSNLPTAKEGGDLG